jgi:hypothetical protein
MKKCPPGVICIENISMFFFIICLIIVGYLFMNTRSTMNMYSNEKIIIKDNQRENNNDSNRWYGVPSWPYNNIPVDPLLNPYVPPLRDERYVVPINISTNVGAVDATYRQVGLLTSTCSKGAVIPLMGRPLFTNRDKWQYYSMSDQFHSVKLPILRNGRSCTNEYGCDKLYSGDVVYVEGLDKPYRVKLYDNDTIRYLPAI